MKLQVKNPHSVLATLKSRPKSVHNVVVSGYPGEAWEEVIGEAKRLSIPVQSGQGQPKKPSRHEPADGRVSATHANIEEKPAISLAELFGTDIDPNQFSLWLALDCVQDPHNVGAIFRTAAFFGVRGILLTQERSAPMSSTVYDVASGGVELVSYSIEVNLQRALDAAKEAGIWILGSSERAQDPIEKIPRDRPWLLVLGSEEKGMRRLTEEACDMTCRLTALGKLQSLNVSVAAGALLASLYSK